MVDQRKYSCDTCNIYKEAFLIHEFKDGKKLCGSCYGEVLRKEGNKNLGISDWVEDPSDLNNMTNKCKFCRQNQAQINKPDSEYHNYCYFCYEQCENSKFWEKHKFCEKCGQEQERKNGMAFCKNCLKNESNRPAFTSICKDCGKEIRNIQGLCECVSNRVFGNGKSKGYLCKTCGTELLYENSVCQSCSFNDLWRNYRKNSRMESVPLEKANDYTFNFCPWCSLDMNFKCNDDWNLNNVAVWERRTHLGKCSNTPQEVKSRITNDHQKFTDKEIAQKIKSGSFRKTTDILSGNYQDEVDREQEKTRLQTEISNLEKKTNRTSEEQVLLEQKRNKLVELNKVANQTPSQKDSSSGNPILFKTIGIAITILVGIGIWVWVKRKFGSNKLKKLPQPKTKTFEKVDNNPPPKKENKISQPLPNKSFKKKTPNTFQYFTCSKCQLTYRSDMKGKNGSCLKCKD